MTDEVGRLDAYVEGVLAGRPAGPRPLIDLDGVDPASRRAADLVARTLVRFHPSFRFEEGLAARLRATGLAMHLERPEAVLGTPAVHEFPGPGLTADADADAVEALWPVGRGLLVGGAIASGLSLAGAAYIAWRRGHRAAS